MCFCLQILWLVSQRCVCSKYELTGRNKGLKCERLEDIPADESGISLIQLRVFLVMEVVLIFKCYKW